MSAKIYISLKESENLIFKKCLILLKNRLDISRAQDVWSVRIILNSEDLIEEDGQYIILFSAVKLFEVPEKDENLFLYYYRVPRGLIVTADRMVRDTSKEEITLPFEENDESADFKDFLRIRNGLVGIVHHKCQLRIAGIKEYNVEKTLSSVKDLTPFKKQLISKLLGEVTFPILKVNIDRFVTDTFYRVTWWGKFISDNYLQTLNFKRGEDQKIVREWLRGFLDFEKIETLNKQLSQVPNELKEEVNFLLGYYFTAIKFESFHLENDFFYELYSEIEYENKNELFQWISFFISFFDSNVSYLYFVESLRSNIYALEKLAFELTRNNLELKNEHAFNLNFKNFKNQNLVTEYVQLKNGANIKEVELINFNDVKDVFKNNLSGENINTLGFEINSQYETYNFKNYCWTTKESFHLVLDNNVSFSDVTFYLNTNSKIKDKLRQLKLKSRRLDRLFHNKKALVGFFPMDETPKSINLYSSLLRDEIDRKFEKIVIVLMVDLEVEKIQSIKFNNYIKSQEKEYKRLFNAELHLIVKNKQTKSDVEIIRNLKVLLENYRVNQIEVIDEYFDAEKATWLIESNTEYYIDREGNNYYSYLNLR